MPPDTGCAFEAQVHVEGGAQLDRILVGLRDLVREPDAQVGQERIGAEGVGHVRLSGRRLVLRHDVQRVVQLGVLRDLRRDVLAAPALRSRSTTAQLKG